MFKQSVTSRHKSPEAPLTHPAELPDSERAKQAPLTGTPYKPYSDKPALIEPPYKPYGEKPTLEPYEPYKGI
jgi:hypothetical protein